MIFKSREYQAITPPMCSHINVASGCAVNVRVLAKLVAKVTAFSGKIEYDVTKPDGAPRKLLDSSHLLSTGWEPAIDPKRGLKLAYMDFSKNSEVLRLD